ncbi:MAG: arsenate reductase ArsC [Acidobacteria bacterium]|nr:arsenate reductase ArsC [Acidobacteriota bacterium]
MGKTKVLFLCTGNSARSQMAEGLLRHLPGERFEVTSAGTRPKGLNLLAVRAMKEVGIDISGHRSKDVAEFQGQDFSYVITVCDRAKQSCPVFPATTQLLHWSLDDPAEAPGTEEERLAFFRRVRDEISERIQEFIRQVG